MIRDSENRQAIGDDAPGQDLTEVLLRKIAECERTREELAKAQEHLRHLVEFNPAVLYSCDPRRDYEATFVSDNVRWLLGYEPHDFMDDPRFWVNHIHPDDAPATLDRVDEASKLDYFAHEYRFRRKDGEYRWLRDEFRILRNEAGEPYEMIGSWVDITDRRNAEDELQLYRNDLEELVLERTHELSESNEQLRREISERKKAVAKLSRTTRALRAVSECNRALMRIKKEPALLRQICRIVVETAGYRLAWIGYASHDERKSVRPVAQAGYDDGYLDSVSITWADNELGRGPTGTAIRTGKPAIAHDILTDPAFAVWRQEAITRGYASSIALPLMVDGQILGALNIYAVEKNAFDQQEVRLLTALARDLSYGIRAIRTRREREQAVEALSKSREQLSTLVEAAPLGVVSLDLQGRVTSWNPAATRILGWTEAETLSKPVPNLSSERLAVCRRFIDRRLRSRSTASVETVVHRKDGSAIDVSLAVAPLHDEYENTTGYLGLIADITERKLAEQREKQLEEHKKDFYRRTILAATEGKLVITEKADIVEQAGPELATWSIRSEKQLADIRDEISVMARSMGMEAARIFDLVLCAGEATTNVVKHAKHGRASLHCTPDGLLFVVSDTGPGIDALALPEVALKKGYTTAISLGMGYKEMISIADKVYLATGPGGTTVAILMNLHPAEERSLCDTLPDTWG